MGLALAWQSQFHIFDFSPILPQTDGLDSLFHLKSSAFVNKLLNLHTQLARCFYKSCQRF